jgi:hypothetical protein
MMIIGLGAPGGPQRRKKKSKISPDLVRILKLSRAIWVDRANFLSPNSSANQLIASKQLIISKSTALIHAIHTPV